MFFLFDFKDNLPFNSEIMHSFMDIYWMWNSRSGFRIFTHIYGGLISLGVANRKAEVIDCVSLAVDLIKVRSQ